ncbi:MAG: CocE/NonD family hydrolase [Treponema sp.]|nr:CocE/NonD family hydrolase [Treponema sp.]
MNLHSFIKKTSSAVALALSFGIVSTFTSCASSQKNTNSENTLPKINMSKWLYNADDNVYYQLGLAYAANPADTKYETLGLFVPGAYFDGIDNGDGTFTVKINSKNTVQGFSSKNAPFVMPIQTPGYAALEAPVSYTHDVKQYTDEGFIFVYAGARGRDSGLPAGVTDFKAAIRYVRYNKENLPGNTQNYFTYGMSGGGAQSALMGATGDAPEYEPYLQEIGAVMTESDAILGSMDWCPITNLNVADAAYEWELGLARTNLSKENKTISEGLSKEFALYINSLGLKDENGNLLTLEQSEDGLYYAGSYYNYLKSVIETSLNNFLSDTKFPYNASKQKEALGQNMMLPPDWKPRGPAGMARPQVSAEDLDGVSRNSAPKSGNVDLSKTYNSAKEYISALNANEEWVLYDEKSHTAKITSVEAFMRNVKQLQKNVGAFDDMSRSQPENTLFGFGDGNGAHFDSIMANVLETINPSIATDYKEDLAKKDSLGTSMEARSNMYNPMYYLSPAYSGYKTAKVAQFWRIHAGIFQGDTAISTELDYALALQNYGSEVKSVDFTEVWGLYHTEAERSGTSTENVIKWIKDCLKA